MLRRIDGACDSLLFVSSPRCENTTARQTAAHPPRGHTPLRRQHGEELEPPHRAFLRGSGSRINYSRSGLRTAAKAARSCPLWLLSNVRFSNRPIEVKRFQTISAGTVLMSLAGSRFSSESAPRPFHHGIRGSGGTIFTAALP